MFNLKEKFEFLEDGIDFPFYNDKPKLAVWEWGIIAVALIIFIILCSIKGIPKTIHALLYFFVMIIPVIYICRGKLSIFFKMPKLKNIKTIILCTLGSIVYGVIMGAILKFSGYPVVGNANTALATNISFFADLFIQLVGEEFFKILLLLILMYVVYRYTENRSLSLWIGIIGTLTIFGLAHTEAYGGRVLQVLLIQGFGSIFDLYAYMKTKNIVVSYIVHILIDLTGFLLPSLSHLC